MINGYTYTEPRANPKRDRLFMNLIAKAKGNYTVPRILKDLPAIKNTSNFEIGTGLCANPKHFMIALTQKVEKLTTHKQNEFFTKLYSQMRKSTPEYIKRLTGYVKKLTTDKYTPQDLVVFNRFKRRFLKLAKINNIDLMSLFKRI